MLEFKKITETVYHVDSSIGIYLGSLDRESDGLWIFDPSDRRKYFRAEQLTEIVGKLNELNSKDYNEHIR